MPKSKKPRNLYRLKQRAYLTKTRIGVDDIRDNEMMLEFYGSILPALGEHQMWLAYRTPEVPVLHIENRNTVITSFMTGFPDVVVAPDNDFSYVLANGIRDTEGHNLMLIVDTLTRDEE